VEGGYRALKGGPELLVRSRPLANSRPHRDQRAGVDDPAAEQSPTNHRPGAKDLAAQRSPTPWLQSEPTTEESDKDATARRLERSQRHSLHRAGYARCPNGGERGAADTWLPRTCRLKGSVDAT
jgi:hypothetical protein